MQHPKMFMYIVFLAAMPAHGADASALAREWRVQAAGSLAVPRAAHQSTPLGADQLLITGGCSGAGCSAIQRTAEIVSVDSLLQNISLQSARAHHTPQEIRREAKEPAPDQLAAPLTMHQPRVAHLASALSDGRVLVAGGWTGTRTTATAEIFDPQRRTFSPVADMLTPRMDATATPLADGSVLITGGAQATNAPLTTSEIFDPQTHRFIAGGAMQVPRAHHVAVRLHDGRVLIAGGLRARKQATNTAEIYDPASRRFTPVGQMHMARCKHAAVLLRDGRVMILGGSTDCDERQRLVQTEIYDPQTQTFTRGPSLIHPRYKIVSAATVLASGEVLVGGDADDVEIWTPGTPAFVRAHGSIGRNLAFSTSIALTGGRALVIGGYDQEIRPTRDIWLVTPHAMRLAPAD